jgi:hypothetical protein
VKKRTKEGKQNQRRGNRTKEGGTKPKKEEQNLRTFFS